ncbi:tRNA-dihydrouridine(20a/20b) synthase [NAD(P)(+)] [Malassezia obtusa]|uniref:tRNA-dihydrouridine synthase n=1 Tax=Malassezia obtusa TaxID=76774 RepID=A0AAF0E2J3_9BASI|nr:tRNA-dihydrouridine(20a/20b) synthase [NAD(P)(+)] [Malassezia obtusa]
MSADAPLALPPHHLLGAFPEINICAPMVRYSKLPFRALTAQYDTHITTTPMILAAEFSRSQQARDADFSTHGQERGIFTLTPDHGRGTVSAKEPPVRVRGALVCQLAASSGAPLADASELVSPFVDGVDINCGCPQPWAYSEQIGSYLLRQPETVRDMVRAIRARLGDGYCVSVKIRVDSDLRNTDTLVRNALHAGASLISVHGRTRTQSSASHPVDLDAVRFAVDAAQACGLHAARGTAPGDGWIFADGGAGGGVPTVVNGDIWTRDDARAWRARTGARGAMSARGLLANPALFSGHTKTPPEAVGAFVERAIAWGLPFSLMQYVHD